MLGAIALGFVVNMVFVIVSRTAMVTMPIMLAVFALLHLKWRTSLIIFGALVVLAGLAWATSPQLQQTADTFFSEYQLYKTENVPTSIGLRLEFWKKSLGFFAEAPVVGHGTGSTADLFEQAATGNTDSATSEVIGNPHNQTLNVAVQWGIVGIILLYAMWLAHLLLFRGEGLVAWIGLLVVVQNIFTSLFNSHLFDFHEGWMYVLGVGVAGGMVLQGRARGEAAGTIRNCPAMIAGMHAADELSAGAGCPANPGIVLQPATEMTRLSQLTYRNYLIAAHDALATAFALLASFYLRFEGSEAFFDRLPLLLRILPFFVAFSVVVCYVFNLTTTKWRFISLPERLNILRVATVLTVALVVLDYAFIFVAPSGKPPFFLGKITIVLYWFLEVFFAERACASPIAISAIRASAVMPGPKGRRRRCWSAAPRTPRCCCAGSRAARSSGSGRSACCRHRPRTAGSRSATFRCWAASTMSRTSSAILPGATSRSRGWS